MSEYQYYEFQAIDRPLTADEMSDLRSYSTRARITPTSFCNDYAWGDFKGDEDAWMEQYFDGFLYLANWGTRVLKLRLPVGLLDPASARTYCGSGSAFVRNASGTVILTFVSEDDECHEWVDGEGHLSALISLRADLARGDLRALYLGWLLRVQTEELGDEELEPSVPPGLGQLNATLLRFTEFLRIDTDLLDVVSMESLPMADIHIDRDRARAWVQQLAAKEKDDLITGILMDADQVPASRLRQRFLEDCTADHGNPSATGRTVGQLREAARVRAEERTRIESKKHAEEEARRKRDEETARQAHLDSLVGCEAKLWAEIDRLIATKQPRNYDRAAKLLVDLRDLDVRGERGTYQVRFEVLREAHARKRSFVERLRTAGLW